jgi:hypothetical protein
VLLEQALATDTGLVSRYTFYLAQSYRDARRFDEAATTYAKRAEMGGWDEEARHARLAAAQTALLCRAGDDARAVLRCAARRATRQLEADVR